MVISKNNSKNIKEFDFKEGGVFLINKPKGWSSFHIVSKFRVILKHNLGIKKIKVGHAGTLDPLADGLMILCCGKKTKEIEQYQAQEKQYLAKIKIGETTPTFDLESEVDEKFDTSHITREIFNETISKFIGITEQMPPVFSAKKVNGKRAYNYARKGKQVELQPIQINVSSIEIMSFDMPFSELLINCSKGTYIRSLANDIGKVLNSGAYLAELKRTAIGEYRFEDAFELEYFENLLK